MSLSLNVNEARRSDSGGVIRETGTYKGVITRAEKLLSEKGTRGVGFSFKADDGATANYLDIYTAKENGELLWGNSLVQSILCCCKLKDVPEGKITYEKWTRDQGIVPTEVPGYPALMNKRIGLILQREWYSHYQTGEDKERVIIVGVFEADTGFTASEILDKKTKPEKLDQKLKALLPVRDSRKKGAAPASVTPLNANAAADFDDDIPF